MKGVRDLCAQKIWICPVYIVNKCYAERKKKGLCCKCGKVPPRKGKVLCQECADKDSARKAEDIRWLKSMHICYRCGRERVFGGEKTCPECLAKAYINNQKSIKKKHGTAHDLYVTDIKKLKEKGLCRACRKGKVVEGHTYCSECLEKQRERSKKRRKIERLNKIGIDRSERFSYGLCYRCGKPLDTDKRLCSACCETNGKNFHGIRGTNTYWQKANNRVFGGAANG